MIEIMVIFYKNVCLFLCVFQRTGGIGVVEIIEEEQFPDKQSRHPSSCANGSRLFR